MRAALVECQTAVDTLRKPGKHRAVEIGKPYLDSNQDHSVSSITDFPGVEALIRAAHVRFGHAEPLWDIIIINVIIRSYHKGGALTPHIDRPDVFGKDVYTCVLENTSDAGLTFHAPKQAKWGDSAVHYRVPEAPGLCVHLMGQARETWKHEVPRLRHGHRLSVSWRFYHKQEPPPAMATPAKQPRVANPP